jgi:hypothetical protein
MTTNATGCCHSCATPGNDVVLAVACTLGAGDFRQRVSDIRALSGRSLRTSQRKPLQLDLTYGLEALAEVEALVAKEAECCSFLVFSLKADEAAVQLSITVPIEALAAAEELFAHFAPDLAQEAA